MLWGIDPLLDADLLYTLRRMGHGDEIAVVDTNFPAASVAASTIMGEPILMAGVPRGSRGRGDPVGDAARHVRARSRVPDGNRRRSGRRAAGAARGAAGGRHARRASTCRCIGVERFAFYERAKSAFAIVPTGERRFYGCFIFKKGVVPPE